MNKFLAAVTMTAFTAGATLSLAAPASASPDWLPDVVVVQALPDGFATEVDRAVAEDLGVQPGDTLPVTWSEGSHCDGEQQCPAVQTASGVYLLDADSHLFAPAGADGPNAKSVYPVYADFVTYDSDGTSGYLGNGPYDRAPGAASLAAFVSAPTDGTTVWVSDETVTDGLTGEEWARIGWGTNDAWVLTSFLDANVEPPVIEPTEEPTVEPTAEPTEEPTTEPAPAADDADSGSQSDSNTSAWMLAGGFFAAALGLSFFAKRRKTNAAAPTEES